ncbi:uncharacterized protein LOC120505150 isoform X2 [Passer montanus]|uniref:uncharacterized protein LOC120505150 isoform X1 n=1 Tax=Passer montanus TaxID=9160 RepID=UPI001961393C|nr:uncharacterized protein LOC120505150 isoform X1 [Passer montanus]XP_039571347.1 uncharacterized protein LOC120505150 isoform X2 [Passer montanus]
MFVFQSLCDTLASVVIEKLQHRWRSNGQPPSKSLVSVEMSPAINRDRLSNLGVVMWVDAASGCCKMNQLPGSAIPALSMAQQGRVRKTEGSGVLSSPVLQLEPLQSLQQPVLTQLLPVSHRPHWDHPDCDALWSCVEEAEAAAHFSVFSRGLSSRDLHNPPPRRQDKQYCSGISYLDGAADGGRGGFTGQHSLSTVNYESPSTCQAGSMEQLGLAAPCMTQNKAAAEPFPVPGHPADHVWSWTRPASSKVAEGDFQSAAMPTGTPHTGCATQEEQQDVTCASTVPPSSTSVLLLECTKPKQPL